MANSNSTMDRVFKTIQFIISAVLVVFFILLVGLRLLGYEPYTIVSGSMDPTYKVGSLVYVQSADTDSIEVGDTITFKSSDMVITHRVVSIDTENKYFYTKGDANNAEDQSPVAFSKVIGKPVFQIPMLGYIALYVSTPLGKAVIVGLIVFLLALSFIPDWINKHKKDDADN